MLAGSPLSIAVLALGGGTGHLLRAIAFARAAATRAHRVRILASSPLAGVLSRALAPSGARVVAIEIGLVGESGTQALRDRARAWLAAEEDDALVVDTFPRGLVGELDGAPVRCPRVLVHRDLADAYALRRETREAAASFDAVIAPGEDGPLAAELGAIRTAPWLIAASLDLASAGAARAAWGAPPGDERPIVVVATTFEDEDARGLVDLARALASELEASVRVVASHPHADGAPVPLARLLGGVDLLVGAGGYHLVHEARATMTPLAALASYRAYDAQARRLRAGERARDLEEITSRIRSVARRTKPPPASIVDGAAEGLRVVEELVSRAGARRPPRGWGCPPRRR